MSTEFLTGRWRIEIADLVVKSQCLFIVTTGEAAVLMVEGMDEHTPYWTKASKEQYEWLKSEGHFNARQSSEKPDCCFCGRQCQEAQLNRTNKRNYDTNVRKVSYSNQYNKLNEDVGKYNPAVQNPYCDVVKDQHTNYATYCDIQRCWVNHAKKKGYTYKQKAYNPCQRYVLERELDTSVENFMGYIHEERERQIKPPYKPRPYFKEIDYVS